MHGRNVGDAGMRSRSVPSPNIHFSFPPSVYSAVSFLLPPSIFPVWHKWFFFLRRTARLRGAATTTTTDNVSGFTRERSLLPAAKPTGHRFFIFFGP